MKKFLPIVFLLLTLCNTSCKSQIFIISVERKVYVVDTLYSNTVVNFKDTSSKVFHLRSEEILEGLKKYPPDTTVNKNKYVTYNILLSDNHNRFIKANLPQQIDNLMRFDGGIDGDETFDVYWWKKKEEFEIITIPSSEYHK